MKRGNPEPLTPELQAELDALAEMAESEIDTTDMPPITDWSHAVRGPFNPPHPGEVIREYLGEMTVSAAAQHLGVGRVTFSRVFNGKAAVPPEMAVRLAAAFGTSSPEVWLRMQAKYDLWQLGKSSKIRVSPLPRLQHS
jgi:addiction module HigA family antidote